MDFALLLLRLIIGVLFFAHSTQKLAGWFQGPGVAKQAGFFESLGLKPGAAMVVLAGVTELTGGVLLALGLATPLGAVMAAGTMVVAALSLIIRSGRFWNVAGGGEYPAVLAAMALVVGFSGAGAYSLDAALAKAASAFEVIAVPPVWVGVVVVAATALAATPFGVVMRRHKAATAA